MLVVFILPNKNKFLRRGIYMKKFLSALIVLTMVLAPTRTNICGAESSIPLVVLKEDKQKGTDSKEAVKQVKTKTIYAEKVLSKVSDAMRSFKEVVKEHCKEIALGVASTASAGLLTWNGYNLVKNPDKVKEILADSTLSVKAKIQAIAKVMSCGVKETETEEQKVEKTKTEKQTETQDNIECQKDTKKQTDQENQDSQGGTSVLADVKSVKKAKKNSNNAKTITLNAKNNEKYSTINETLARVVEAKEKLDLDEVENINKTSIMNNLDEQCKVINTMGSIVDCGLFGVDTCCEYTDANGTIKSEVLVKGSPVKEYTIIAVVSLVGVCFFIAGCYIMNF